MFIDFQLLVYRRGPTPSPYTYSHGGQTGDLPSPAEAIVRAPQVGFNPSRENNPGEARDQQHALVRTQPPRPVLLFRPRERPHSETSGYGYLRIHTGRRTSLRTLLANATIHHLVQSVLHSSTTFALPLPLFEPGQRRNLEHSHTRTHHNYPRDGARSVFSAETTGSTGAP